MEVIIEVEKDYDGYFERRVRQVIDDNPGKCIYKKVVISSGPWRSYGMQIDVKDEVAHLDFYSALRTGFGSLSDQEILEALQGKF